MPPHPLIPHSLPLSPSPSPLRHYPLSIIHYSFCLLLAACTTPSSLITHPSLLPPSLLPLAPALASSSINTVIFRHSPLVTFQDTQYAAFYDADSHVVLAKRTLGGKGAGQWQIKRTGLTGNTNDAHNTISLGIDGTGILHLAWNHHGANLNYVQSIAPGSLELTPPLPMDGTRETQVTYPEFYALPSGADALVGRTAGVSPASRSLDTPGVSPAGRAAPSDLLFLYRVGASGNGDLALKRYRTARKQWETVAPNLVAGEGRQNAYPEFAVGPDGTLHLAWTWRRTPDVSTNHDICYAQSHDVGITWTTSTGKPLTLPITAATAEVALPIPEQSELINQTTIAGDLAGHPYIATYFRPTGSTIPQYHLIYHDGQAWHTLQITQRKTPFTLAGGGTKRIPISRPLILVDSAKTPPRIQVVFRDAERQDHATLATIENVSAAQPKIAKKNELAAKNDQFITANNAGIAVVFSDLTTKSWGSWEPSFDPLRWQSDHILDLFIQKTDQLDGNDAASRTLAPTMAYVLEYQP